MFTASGKCQIPVYKINTRILLPFADCRKQLLNLCTVYLLDVTPPSVHSCPNDVIDRTNVLQKAVTWTPPTFTDNAGVVSVLSNRQPGFMMDAYTSLTVQYTASDAAGNVVYCTFNVTLEGICAPSQCQEWPRSNTMQCYAMLCNARQRNTVRYGAVSCCSVQYNAINAMQCNTMTIL